MWENCQQYWRWAATSAAQTEVHLVFLVMNAIGDEGTTFVAGQLRRLARRSPYLSVLELKPTDFGLKNMSVEERREAFAKRFTLGYDPHGNAVQHRIIAEALFDHLSVDTGLIDEMRE